MTEPKRLTDEDIHDWIQRAEGAPGIPSREAKPVLLSALVELRELRAAQTRLIDAVVALNRQERAR